MFVSFYNKLTSFGKCKVHEVIHLICFIDSSCFKCSTNKWKYYFYFINNNSGVVDAENVLMWQSQDVLLSQY